MQTFKEGQKIWGEILSNFKSTFSPSAYKTWFLGTSVLAIEKENGANLIVIGVKNSFLKEQIENRYLNYINQFLVNRNLANTKINFVVGGKKDSEVVENTPLFSGIAQNQMSSFKNPDNLNSDYTFENLVVGSSNNLAYLASKNTVENLGKLYNPLLIYGTTGVGKTHLLHAIGNDARKRINGCKVIYATSEKFTCDYIESLRNKNIQFFRQKYRGCDLLLIDDVQFLAGKESTQDEFFHTFNELCLSSKQIVVASDKHPKELGGLNDRLVSRFLGGMACDIGVPDLEMKIAIVKSKCLQKNINLEDEAVFALARGCSGGARELEGLLISLVTQNRFSGIQIDKKHVLEILNLANRSLFEKPTPGKIIGSVCKHFKVSLGDMQGISRKARFVLARQMAMYLLRLELGVSFGQIGSLVGGRDHSTVIYGIEKMRGLISSKQNMRDEFLRIRSLLEK